MAHDGRTAITGSTCLPGRWQFGLASPAESPAERSVLHVWSCNPTNPLEWNALGNRCTLMDRERDGDGEWNGFENFPHAQRTATRWCTAGAPGGKTGWSELGELQRELALLL